MSGSAVYMIISAIITIGVLSVTISFAWRYRVLFAVCHILLNIVACIVGIVFLAKQIISVGFVYALTQLASTLKGFPWYGILILADILFLTLSFFIVYHNEKTHPHDWERLQTSPPPSDEDIIRVHSGDIYSDDFMNIYRVVSINENNVRLEHLGNLENRRNYHDAAGGHIYGGTGTVFADKKGQTSELLNGKEYFYDKLFVNGTEIFRIENSWRSPNYKYNSLIKEQ